MHRQHPTKPRRQPIRSRTCTDFDRWTCLACTDFVFDRSARCGSAQLDTWLLICSLLSAPLSSLGSALFSRLCSGSALFATARGSSTRASAASLGLRLCLAHVALFGLTWLGSRLPAQLGSGHQSGWPTAALVGCWRCSAERMVLLLRSAVVHILLLVVEALDITSATTRQK